jgi:hypothetical protein
VHLAPAILPLRLSDTWSGGVLEESSAMVTDIHAIDLYRVGHTAFRCLSSLRLQEGKRWPGQRALNG